MTNDKYIEIIKNQAATPKKVKPIQKVINNQVINSALFSVEQFGQQYIYKISDPETSFRNLMLAQLLIKNGVSVPDSKTFVNNGVYFETYKLIPGNTLSVALQELQDIPQSTLESILYNTLEYDKKISETKIPNKTMMEQLLLYTRREKHNTHDFGKILAKIHYIINKRNSTYGNVALHHADLNPSNILLYPNLELKAILDLDGIALCDEYTMLSQILLYWPNVSLPKVVEIYKSVFDRDINQRHLKNIVRFNKAKTKIAKTLRTIIGKTK